MNPKFYRLRFFALFAALLFSFPVISAAQPANANEIKKLPPVHYIRSRDYDMRHNALNLKFDWEKEQTYGTATITLAPLVPNLKIINLDAGLMMINSVKLNNGTVLQHQYDEKKAV